MSATEKAPGGLDRGLYVRVNGPLMDGLGRVLERRAVAEPGRRISQADVVREILWAAIQVSDGGPKGPRKAERS